MSLVPVLFLAVILTLVLNLVYSIYSKRSRATLAWSQMRQPIKRRNMLVSRMAEEFPLILERFPAYTELSALIDKLSDENDQAEAVLMESDIAVRLEALQRELRDDTQLAGESEWSAFQETWEDVKEELLEAGINYNRRVIVYNEAILAFPANLVARLLGYQAMPDVTM